MTTSKNGSSAANAEYLELVMSFLLDTIGDDFRICVRIGKKLVEPTAASRNRCDQERTGLGAYRTSVLRWKPRGQKNLPASRGRCFAPPDIEDVVAVSPLTVGRLCSRKVD